MVFFHLSLIIQKAVLKCQKKADQNYEDGIDTQFESLKIHIYICGPFPNPTLNGSRYCISFLSMIFLVMLTILWLLINLVFSMSLRYTNRSLRISLKLKVVRSNHGSGNYGRYDEGGQLWGLFRVLTRLWNHSLVYIAWPSKQNGQLKGERKPANWKEKENPYGYSQKYDEYIPLTRITFGWSLGNNSLFSELEFQANPLGKQILKYELISNIV